MTQRTVLDTAGFFNVSHTPSISQSDWRDGALLTRNINGVARDSRRFSLSWRPASAYQRRALREHFAANVHTAFDLNLPNATLARVVYGSAPVTRFTSATAVEMSVELIEAHEES